MQNGGGLPPGGLPEAPPRGERFGPLNLWINSGRLDLVVKTEILRTPEFDLAVREVTNPRQVAVWLRTLQPDLVLLDEASLATSIGEWLLALRARETTAKVIVLYDQSVPLTVNEILRYGVWGCLPFSTPAASYVKALRAVSNGEIWLPRNLLMQALTLSLANRETRGGTAPAHADGPEALTPRERCVGDLVAQGLSNKEVARELCISEDTVKKHLKNVFCKLGVHRRSRLWSIGGSAPGSA